LAMKLKEISYEQHEYLHRPKVCKGTLLTLIYDIPYFPSCGVFPPLHILNQVFSRGGSPGGMGPGATWKPFTLSEEEYDVLVREVKTTPLSEIKTPARYAFLSLKFDPSFDHIEGLMEWSDAVCHKHRDEWHAELRRAGFLK